MQCKETYIYFTLHHQGAYYLKVPDQNLSYLVTKLPETLYVLVDVVGRYDLSYLVLKSPETFYVLVDVVG